MNRREFLSLSAQSAVVGTALAHPLSNALLAASQSTTRDIKAVCFDAFPVFNPKPLLALANKTFPGEPDFAKLWFNRIFAYTWLRTSGFRYKDFPGVIEDALDYMVTDKHLTLRDGQKETLLRAWLELKIWPDIPQALTRLQSQNIRLSFLSNFSEEMLRINARNNGLEDAFEYLSTDRARVFKPHPDAYRLGTEHYRLAKENIAFCAFAAWDAAGAKWFGYPTVWVNRLGSTSETLGSAPDISGPSIETLLNFAVYKN